MRSSKKYVDQTLKLHQLTANKALGQNFLVNEQIVDKIIGSSEISCDSTIIEIGPGLGALTEKLVLKAKHVIAIEIDQNMCSILNESFADVQNLTIIHQDFLKLDLDDLFLKLKDEKEIIIVSNLPYYITTQIINKIIYNRYPITSFIAMMQKEVGSKILNPSLKDLSPLHILFNYTYQISLVTHVSKNDYLPRPEIDSIVLKFKKIAPKYELKDETLFYQIVKDLFKNRRKTITNNLLPYFENKEVVISFLKQLNLSQDLRIEQLSLEQIILISKSLGA